MNGNRLVIILLFILIGLVYSAENIIYTFDSKVNYKGISLATSLDEWAYTAFAREAAEGNYSLKHQYYYEPKQTNEIGYNSLQPIPFWILGVVYKLVGMNTNLFTILSKFLFAGFIFLALYWLLKELNCSNNFSIFASLTSILLPSIWVNDFILFLNVPWGWHFIFQRPGANVAVFLLISSLAAMLYYLRSGKKFSGSLILVSIISALTIQSYFFVGIAYGTFLVVYLLLNFKKNQIRQKLLLIISCSVLLSIPTIIKGVQFLKQGSLWGDLHYRYPHIPMVSMYLILSIALLCFLIWKRKFFLEDNYFTFYISLLLSHIICLNQQIITGINLEPHHFNTFVFPLLTWVIIFRLSYFYFKKKELKCDINFIKSLFIKNKKTFFLLIVIIIGFILVLYVSPKFPRPQGGIFGKGIRFSSDIIRTFFTWALAVPLIMWSSFFISKTSKKIISFSSLYLSLIVILTIILHYQSVRFTATTQLQEYANAFKWLENNSPKESVILATPIVGDFITSYTHNNVYFCDYGIYLKKSEFRQRLFNQFAFAGITPAILKEFIDPESPNFDVSYKFCLFFWREFGNKNEVKMDRGRYLECYTNDDIVNSINEYNEYLRNWNIKLMNKLRVDYVIIGPFEKDSKGYVNNWYFRDSISNIISQCKPVYFDKCISIYKFNDIAYKNY
jgi:hypothetical protein